NWNGGGKGKQGDFRGKFRGPEPGAPVPRHKTAPAGLGAQIIARILLKPTLAGLFDVAVTDADHSPVGAACRVAAFVRDHDFEVTQAQIIEHFRGTNDEAEVGRASMHPLLTDMEGAHPEFDLDAEFDEALARLREQARADEEWRKTRQ